MSRLTSATPRHLAAILCADVAGYSRLMNSDEIGTLRLLNSHRGIVDREIDRCGGRIANTAGDSVLAEFPSAVDAVQCALGIQERIGSSNQEVPDERRVTFRMGVHVGEIMVRDGDLYGDGVNVAARLEGIARPGSVCLSGSAHEFVHRVLPLIFEDLGPQLVKNLDTPVRAYLVHPSDQPPSRALPPVHRENEFHLSRRFRALTLDAIEVLVKPEGLTAVEPAVLASLSDGADIDERRLAERIGVDYATTRRIVKHLEFKGLVTRTASATKRGPSYVQLTCEGAELF